MKKLIFLICIIGITISCRSQNDKNDYLGEWIEIKKQNDNYVIIKCDYEGDKLIVSDDTIIQKETMEDSNYKINHITTNEKSTFIFPNENEDIYIKFEWIDKQRGVAKWQILDNNSRFYVIKSKFKELKSIKGTIKDCITNEEAGDVVNDSFLINNSNDTFSIDDDNCISIKNKKQETILENCYEGTMISIRHISKDFIPLTFISGQNSIDINFYKKNNNWISKEATLYTTNANGEVKQTKNISISLKEFNFDVVKERFEDEKKLTKNYFSLDEIKNKNEVLTLDIYKISDILNESPISSKNVTIYNDAAFYLLEAKKYNEARIILLEVIKFSPNRVVAYLNLGDAEWGFGDKISSKKHYENYISLMKSQNKDLKKIPQRVYDRLNSNSE